MLQNFLFHFMTEPRAEIKIGWATDRGGSGMKFFKKYFNMEARLNKLDMS